MTEPVLVSGRTGYIAGWCIAQLLERGYRVRTTIRREAKERADRDAVRVGTEPVVHVLRVASPLSGDDMLRPARDGALNVLRAAAAAEVKRVVVTSAANAASPPSYTEEGITDETLCADPDDSTLIPYRRAKTVLDCANSLLEHGVV
jgi:nucleoside-diphosphate-sugar epimerase